MLNPVICTFLLVHPTVIRMSIESSLKQNDTLAITCTGFGSPRPQMKLIHNSSTIVEQRQGGFDITPSITFTNSIHWNVTGISAKDSGLYTCEVENVIGVASSNNSIIIKGIIFFKSRWYFTPIILSIIRTNSLVFQEKVNKMEIISVDVA